MNSIIRLLIFATWLICLGFSHCIAQDHQATANPPVFKLGAIQSTTGIAALHGTSAIRGIQLAVEDWNNAHTEKIELLTENDNSDPHLSLTCFERLHAKKADAIIGATWDFLSNPLMALSKREKTPLLVTGATVESLKIELSDGYAFSNHASILAMSEPFRRYINGNKFNKIGFIYVNNSWGENQLRVYKETVSKEGHQTVFEITQNGMDGNDWSQNIPLIKSKHPDLIALILNRDDVSLFIKKAKELQLSARIFDSWNMYDSFRLSKSPHDYDGMCFGYPVEQVASQEVFNKNFTNRFHEEPLSSASYAYDGVGLLAEAYFKTKQNNSSIPDNLRATHYKGIVGTYAYNSTYSLSLGSSSLICINEGKLEVVPK